MPKSSIQGRFIFLLAAIVIGTVVLAVILTLHWDSWRLVIPVVVLIALLAVVVAVKSFFRPLNETLQALRSGVASFKDKDYSVTISSDREDELGLLVKVYNELATTLREERFNLFQRELLLDTVIHSSAVAVVIVNHRGVIVYSNREAVDLLSGNGAIEGAGLAELCKKRSPVLEEAIADGKDGLMTLSDREESDVYHLTCRQFSINAQLHGLYLFKKLTREIARQEVDTWKKVIRVITHELNNSLAPITSLTASARKISASGTGTEKLQEIYQSIGNRSSHLQSFIEQYAQFARLPKPRVQRVNWAAFIDQLKRLVHFHPEGELPAEPAYFDTVQMEQVLINLIKNAAESGSVEDEIRLRILQNREEILMAVEDRGCGMDPEQMKLALLPFYSTKRRGTGLGLPLCREIVEAHGGSFQLFNRERGGLAAICRIPQPADSS